MDSIIPTPSISNTELSKWCFGRCFSFSKRPFFWVPTACFTVDSIAHRQTPTVDASETSATVKFETLHHPKQSWHIELCLQSLRTYIYTYIYGLHPVYIYIYVYVYVYVYMCPLTNPVTNHPSTHLKKTASGISVSPLWDSRLAIGTQA